jgi:hypothetical protein
MKKTKVQSIGSRKKRPLGKNRSGTRTAEETAGKTTIPDWAKLEVPVDFVEARKNIAKLVRMSVNEIAGKFIELAKEGEVAPAKYLFEVVGLYPVTEEAASKPEHSLAYTLLKRMGLPTEPMTDEESFSSVIAPGAS